MNIARFEEQHVELWALLRTLERQLDPEAIIADAKPISQTLQQLGGKFAIHLSIEDATLYPNLGRQTDTLLRDLAQRFQTEMGGLKASFDAFRAKWPGPLAIGRNPVGFVLEAKQILTALKSRLDREDRDLYPRAKKTAA